MRLYWVNIAAVNKHLSRTGHDWRWLVTNKVLSDKRRREWMANENNTRTFAKRLSKLAHLFGTSMQEFSFDVIPPDVLQVHADRPSDLPPASEVASAAVLRPVPLVPWFAAADGPVVERFRAALQHYDGVRVWDTWTCGAGTRAGEPGSRPLVFWSANAAREWGRGREPGGPADAVILVRLDETAWPPLGRPTVRVARDIDATGLAVGCRWHYGRVIWRAVTEIVGELRGVRPLEPALDLEVTPDGQPVQQGNYFYFAHCAVMGSEPIEALEVPDSKGNFHRKVPAVPAEDGGYAFRFSVPTHVAGENWVAFLSFGLSASSWRTVDLRPYRELRFDARADCAGAPLSVSLDDAANVPSAPGRHNKTSHRSFKLWEHYPNGEPFVVKLDTLAWGADAAYGNDGPVNRYAMLQIVFGNSDRSWPSGPRWIEVRNVVLL